MAGLVLQILETKDFIFVPGDPLLRDKKHITKAMGS